MAILPLETAFSPVLTISKPSMREVLTNTEKIFMLNCAADRYVLRPVAKAYNDLVLDGEKDAIHNMLDNVAMPKRFINSLLQGKFNGAAREVARFLINSTLGMGGMTDVAK